MEFRAVGAFPAGGLYEPGQHDLSSLRLVLFAGELFPLKYLCRLQEAVPGARFCNMYGQTEANTSTYYWVEQLPPDAKAPLPIGKALPNFDVFALDENGKQIRTRAGRRTVCEGVLRGAGLLGGKGKDRKGLCEKPPSAGPERDGVQDRRPGPSR